jgi:hypothetical protein
VSESKALSFIAQLRTSGAKGGSLIITIPKEIVDILKLNERDYCKFVIEKVKVE